MRLELFHWIEERVLPFGTHGLLNYTERVTDRLNKRNQKIYRITEIMFTIGIKDAPDELQNTRAHKKWKAELEAIVKAECEGCNLRFEADSSVRNVSPDLVEIARGAKPEGLVPKRSFTLTANVFLRNPIEED